MGWGVLSMHMMDNITVRKNIATVQRTQWTGHKPRVLYFKPGKEGYFDNWFMG
jgi:hypothetical protein